MCRKCDIQQIENNHVFMSSFFVSYFSKKWTVFTKYIFAAKYFRCNTPAYAATHQRQQNIFAATHQRTLTRFSRHTS